MADFTQVPSYAVYGLRYATRDALRKDHFVGGDPHEAPMPMDYFVWVIVGNERVVVVDTGFTQAIATVRGRTHLRCPVDSLQLLGIDAAAVSDVVITHMHYDHAGNLAR